MKISAVIFDLNGTILSDEDEYGLAFKKVLERLGTKNVEEYPHVSGIGVEENWPILLKKYNIRTDKTVGELTGETQNEYLKLLPNVVLKEGFLDTLKVFIDSGVKVGLATSNTWGIVEKIFDKFNLESYFDAVTTKEEISRNKPDPEIFGLTAEKLGTDPGDCLVFEDSPAGITAAHNAGMRVIGIARDSEHKEILKEADIVIEQYSRLTI